MGTSSRVFSILGVAFCAVAAVMLVLSAIFTVNTVLLLHNGVRTQARAVAIDTDSGQRITRRGVAKGGTTVFEYGADGRTYTIYTADDRPLSHDVGDTVTIVYDPDNPGRATWTGVSAFGLTIPFAAMLVAFGGVGLPFLMIGTRRVGRMRRLRRAGATAWGTVTAVQLNGHVVVNGQSPRRVTATWQDPWGTERTSTGEKLFPGVGVGGRVLVRYDPQKPEINFVDLDARD